MTIQPAPVAIGVVIGLVIGLSTSALLQTGPTPNQPTAPTKGARVSVSAPTPGAVHTARPSVDSRVDCQDARRQVEELTGQLKLNKLEHALQLAASGGVLPIEWDDPAEGEQQYEQLTQALESCDAVVALSDRVQIRCEEPPCAVLTRGEDAAAALKECEPFQEETKRWRTGYSRRQVSSPSGSLEITMPVLSDELLQAHPQISDRQKIRNRLYVNEMSQEQQIASP